MSNYEAPRVRPPATITWNGIGLGTVSGSNAPTWRVDRGVDGKFVLYYSPKPQWWDYVGHYSSRQSAKREAERRQAAGDLPAPKFPEPLKRFALAMLSRADVERIAGERNDVYLIHAWQTAKDVAEAFSKAFEYPIANIAPYIVSEYWNGESLRWSSATMKPTTVLVMTEGAPITEPYYDKQSLAEWQKAIGVLKANPLIDDAGFESINAAVHYVWIKPKMVG